MQLPIFFTSDRSLSMMQTKWASIIQPVLNQPINDGSFLYEVALISGDNVINHLLGRQMQGWFLTDIDAAATIYRSAALNDQTLTLNSSASCTVNIYVF